MNIPWPVRKLRDISDVRVSNVDKKVYSSERPIRLCNYMDVYSNDYVRSTIEFMDGSATPAEIERFGLHFGDVIITKDSESPDDIGVPAVIAEEIENLVCGYHLAVIRPNHEEVDSIYLAKQISTSTIARYFALQASGSTRFGLPIGAIESVEVPTPPKPEQSKIAEVLSTVDRAIEQTEALIAKQQRIKTGLMQDLLTKGIDEHGNLRNEATHEFKDSPLGRIPVEWDVVSLNNLCTDIVDCPHTTPSFLSDGVLVARTFNLKDGQFVGDRSYVSEEEYKSRVSRLEPKSGDVIFTREAPVGEAFVVPDKLKICLGQRTMIMRSTVELLLPNYLLEVIYSEEMRIRFDNMVGGTTNPHLNVADVRALSIRTPSVSEQTLISDRVQGIRSATFETRKHLEKLAALKAALMQDLLTGKKRVTPLLKMDT